MSRPTLPAAILAGRVIAVCRGLDPDRLAATVGALRRGGVSLVEVTMDSPGAVESIALLTGMDDLTVGAGTCRSIDEVGVAAEAGAAFLVAPHTDPAVVDWAAIRGLPFLPGAMTPSEIAWAWDLGAAAVKVFPASGLGPGFVRALAGPLGDVPLVPTGGITAATVADYLDAGAVAVGLGGWLTGSPDLAVVEERSAAVTAAAAGG